uniref:Signal peptidase complex catalytic subunit SEC11 n=1 Tax=Neogobius melanostomus TaxID=47308 RepID=A0A8C6SGN0_9GOBI
MEPGIKRGDVLFASNSWLYPIKVGDVIMFRTKARKNPIVHRVVKSRQNGEYVYLTKGDKNDFDDSHRIYEPGQRWLEKEDVLARVFWSVLAHPSIHPFSSGTTRDTVERFLQIHKAHVDWLGELPRTLEHPM